MMVAVVLMVTGNDGSSGNGVMMVVAVLMPW